MSNDLVPMRTAHTELIVKRWPNGGLTLLAANRRDHLQDIPLGAFSTVDELLVAIREVFAQTDPALEQTT